jgi:16S rRNA (guanine527-N7)-methyltransferase
MSPSVQSLGESLGGPVFANLLQYFDRFMQDNKRLGLSSLSQPDEVMEDLFLDSLSLLPILKVHPAVKSILDIGTGGGLPGLALKIACPDLRVGLLDSSSKKLGFCHMVSLQMMLKNVDILAGRIEDLGHDPRYRGQFDLVTAKAVAKLPTLLEYALPFLKEGGFLAAYKAESPEEEIKSADSALRKLNGKVLEVQRFTLAKGDKTRSLVLVEKMGKTPEEYPRKPDLPKSEPL